MLLCISQKTPTIIEKSLGTGRSLHEMKGEKEVFTAFFPTASFSSRHIVAFVRFLILD